MFATSFTCNVIETYRSKITTKLQILIMKYGIEICPDRELPIRIQAEFNTCLFEINPDRIPMIITRIQVMALHEAACLKENPYL